MIKPKNNMARTISLSLLLFLFSASFVIAQSVIRMEKIGGVFYMPCEINGLKMRFIFDTGASDVVMSLTEALYMLKNGHLDENDLRGTTYSQIANGEIIEGTKINLRVVKIGDKTLYNVPASITHTLDAPLLLGQSALSKLGRFQMDYSNNTLTFLDHTPNASRSETSNYNQSPPSNPVNNTNNSLKTDIFANSMVLVKGGTFLMGCSATKDGDCELDETPTHWVTLSDFYIGKYEVTQKEWKAMMGTDPSGNKNCDNCPVEKVSWNDVQLFISKLNSVTEKKYRLPTEAEWEYAARGGVNRQGYKYSGSNILDEVGWFNHNDEVDWFNKNSGSKTHPVGQKKSNSLGLYDMSGNVWEWCSDLYGRYSGSSQANPKGSTNTGTSRVLRGGSWLLGEGSCRSANRNYGSPDDRFNYIGFRLVRTP
jgi:clan AA aspartic protease (TIGR02281 family)